MEDWTKQYLLITKKPREKAAVQEYDTVEEAKFEAMQSEKRCWYMVIDLNSLEIPLMGIVYQAVGV